MTSLGDGVLTLQLDSSSISGLSTDLEFEFHILQELPNPVQKPGSVIPLDKPTNNVIFSLGGKKEKMRAQALLYDKGDDVSNGTLATAIGNGNISDSRFSDTDGDGSKDVRNHIEQKIWLTEYIDYNSLSAEWQLYGLEYSDRISDGNGIPVFIQDITPRRIPGLKIPVDLTLLVGDRL